MAPGTVSTESCASAHLALGEEDAAGPANLGGAAPGPPARAPAAPPPPKPLCTGDRESVPPVQLMGAGTHSCSVFILSGLKHVGLAGQKGPEAGLATQGPLLSAGIQLLPPEEGARGVGVASVRLSVSPWKDNWCWPSGVIQTRPLLPPGLAPGRGSVLLGSGFALVHFASCPRVLEPVGII